jgi:hypothetical protein
VRLVLDDKQYGIFSFSFFIDEVDHIILLNKLRAMGLLTGLINILLVELKLLSLFLVFNALLETNTKEYHSAVHHLHKKSTNNIVIFIFAQIMPSGVLIYNVPSYKYDTNVWTSG